METKAIRIALPEGCNIIVGQAHFIKTVEDISEIVISSVPQAKFGLAFCEASGPCLVRTEGNDRELIKAAADYALEVAAGHTFYLVLKNVFPINVLTQIKLCQEVANIYCATANPLEILAVQTNQGRGIIGVIDGSSPKDIETENDKKDRHDILRKFGYKF